MNVASIYLVVVLVRIFSFLTSYLPAMVNKDRYAVLPATAFSINYSKTRETP